MQVNLRSFKQRVRHNQRSFRRFLTKIEKNPPRHLDKIAEAIDAEVWQEVDCLSCANCCKTMSPTFSNKDIKRIAAHLEMTTDEFKEKWLYFDKADGDWMNVKQPCQFLDLRTNMCSIYEVRPDDCAGFPHLKKKKMTDYIHVHKQNVAYCPATFKMVEKMMSRL
ncbi:YkgJ family cysteine cluster protein [Asinibacterium sp. OR53]|uniref:YkgJ family cysteine cluster protein n=1 Tax=Asinibacterium sp. OR53 TaxID=925409 RepID=UPI000478F179|nr:YkgJ family cysteine cluster protein [Asinibacterium sp. OR53]